jgi:DNA-binding CsgD family transcriptional regulator
MSQLVLFTYALALVLGLISIGITGIMALWTKKSSLLILLLFYSAYTLDMFAEIVHRYMLINIPELWVKISLFWNPVMIFSRFFLLFAILIFWHYFTFKGCKKRKVVVYSISATSCFLVSLLVHLNKGRTETLGITIPDYIYFVFICLILATGIIYIIRSKQTESEFLSLLEYSFLKKVIIFFTLSFPLIINDDFAYIETPFRFAPLIYTLFSILIFHHIYSLYLTVDSFKEYSDPSDSSVFQKYSISGREKEIVLLVLKGYSNKKISEELFISLSTVKSHMYKIFKKMGVKTRFELMQTLKSV